MSESTRTMATETTNGKTPKINRVKNIRQRIGNDLFNQNHHWLDSLQIEPASGEFNVADIFSGCGGMTLGFLKAGFNPVFGVEIDPDAAATFRDNFEDAYHYEGPVQDLTEEDVLEALDGRQVHVLCAGFPCQGFSVAGARDPKDERNQLFREFVRFAKILKPWFVVGENVPGVVTLDGGSFHALIRDEFAAAGYRNISTQVLEAAEFGVPQLRPRAIYVGNRFGLENPYPEPQLEPEEFVPIEDAIDDLKDHPRDPSINHEWTRHGDDMIERLSKVAPGESLYDSYQDAWKRQYKGYPAMTVKENHGGVHVHHELNRTISAREMARLQSFPDEFIFSGRMKRVMFQIGNAVPPVLAENVALALIPSLREIAKREHESDWVE